MRPNSEINQRIPLQSRWLSVIEVADHLGVKQDTVYKWLQRKHMPAHKVGRLWKFRLSEVDRWVKSGKAAKRGQGEH